MRAIFSILIILFALFLFSCSNKAAEMYENAKFEELQNNKAHAVEIYEEIVKKYPESEQARMSKERLAQMK